MMQLVACTEVTNTNYLSFVEISNFKSYVGVQRFGPLTRHFISVVGSNGAGKSNLMDAIGFVFNERTRHLRAKNLGELVYGSAFSKPTKDPVFVKATFCAIAGSDQQLLSVARIQSTGSDSVVTNVFTRRIVSRSGCLRNVYEVNEKEVQDTEYDSTLLSIGINVNARNFMIFQGQIESVAALTPRERTIMIEELIGSKELKLEYENLCRELNVAIIEDKKSRQLLNTIRDDFSKLNDLLAKKSELEQLEDQMEHEKLQVFLTQLYYNECETNRLVKDISDKRTQLDRDVKERQQVLNDSEKVNKKRASLEKILGEAEESLSRMELQLAKKLGVSSANKETLLEVEKEADLARRALGCSKSNLEKSRQNVNELQANLDLLGQQAVQEQAELSSLDAVSGENTAAVQAEYRSLRAKVDILVHDLRLKKQSVLNSISAKKFKLNKEEQKQAILLSSINHYTDMLDESDKKMCEVNGKIGSLQRSLLNFEASEEKFEQAEKLRGKLIVILDEEKEDDIEKNFRNMVERKQGVIQDLQAHFRGIHGRVYELCIPIHERYNVAVTKVMGSHMNSIVCETTEVARAAIAHLKAHRHQRETFLPLDNIHASLIDDKVRREISKLSNVRLIFDIVNLDAKFTKVALFCFHKTVVCESEKEAKRIARRDDGERFSAVSLDGIMYNVSGIISGGLKDLLQKSKQWDLQSKARKDRADQKKTLEIELNELLKGIGKKSRVELQKTAVSHKKLVDCAEEQKCNTINHRDKIAAELEQFRNKSRSKQDKMRDLRVEVTDLSHHIEEVETAIAAIEDEVFQEFCAQHQVTNVREYDQRFNDVEKILQQRSENENIMKRLLNQISDDMERTLLLETDVAKYEAAVLRHEETLRRLNSQLPSNNQEIEKLKCQIQAIYSTIASSEHEISLSSTELHDLDKTVQEFDEKITQIKLKISADEVTMEGCRQQRHHLLLSAQKLNVSLPMINGSMTDIAFASEQSENEDQITLDYSGLRGLLQLSTPKLKHAIVDLKQRLIELESDVENLRAKVDPSVKTKISAVSLELKSRVKRNKVVMKKLHDAKSNLDKVRTKRLKAFIDCFEVISSNINSTYKALTQKQDVHIYMDLENTEEPYLGGVTLGCIPSGKRYRPMEDLSGGEKTIAALAFIFSFQAYKSSPFIVMDEVDASLDFSNIDKVVNFIKSSGYQFLVISLKEQMYMEANALLGISAEVSKSDSGVISSVFTGLLDLDEYADDSERVSAAPGINSSSPSLSGAVPTNLLELLHE